MKQEGRQPPSQNAHFKSRARKNIAKGEDIVNKMFAVLEAFSDRGCEATRVGIS